MKGRYSFSVDCRIRTSAEYQTVWQKGRRYHTAHFLILVNDKPSGKSRLGLTVSRKIGKAVHRNRLKRWLREGFRYRKNQFRRPVDISIIAKHQAGKLTHQQVSQELSTVFVRLEAEHHD